MRWLALTLILLAGCGTVQSSERDDLSHLQIISSDGTTHEFRVEIVESVAERRKGLSFRQHLDQDAGMLFLFERSRELSFWMKDTFIPLDIIFINKDDRIHRIHPKAEPMRREQIRSKGKVNTVLEINGGLSEKLGITEGDLVQLR